MQRTISIMVGKGSVRHNSRKFIADNVSIDRTKYNIKYYDENLKEIYHEIFDGALKKYNDKQNRSDRKISDYYEKIRTSKQEKLFHEVIIQIGNRDSMNVQTENGKLAAKILNEYMNDFEKRNPQLKVFSAHLHMDEETPHLHIDFVPFTTGSNRGLETRVSLKKALSMQGFKGGTRNETEWNQWVKFEKEQLAQVMNRYNVQWLQLETHEKHLNVLEFEKQKRAEEVATLESKILEKSKIIGKLNKAENNLSLVNNEVEKIKNKFKNLKEQELSIELNAREFDEEKEWQLSEPTPFMSCKSYKEKKVVPLIEKLKAVIRSVISQYFELKGEYKKLSNTVLGLQNKINNLLKRLDKSEIEIKEFRKVANEYDRVRNVLGKEQTDSILTLLKQQEEKSISSIIENER